MRISSGLSNMSVTQLLYDYKKILYEYIQILWIVTSREEKQNDLEQETGTTNNKESPV